MNLSYILNHLGEERDQYFGAVSAPIIQTSNFAFRTVADYRQAMTDEKKAHLYTRGNNPTVQILCKKLAALQGSEDALVLASGMAAVSTAVISQLKAGDHLVCVEQVYGWARKLFTILLARYGVTVTFVKGVDPLDFQRACTAQTKLFYLESPTSLLFNLQDLEAISNIAASKGITTILDNSYGGVLSPSPHQMGIDITVHSATKYIGGHSDVLAGVICGSSEKIQQMFSGEYMTLGGIIGPQDAWLLIRSLRTLPIRLERSRASALRIVAFLQDHPAVDRIIYPFSPSHPQYELARKHMPQPLPLFTVVLKSEDRDRVEAFCNKLEYFLMAPSWGGHESLIFPTCVFDPKNNQIAANIIRFYIGLEDPEVLIEDLASALATFGEVGK